MKIRLCKFEYADTPLWKIEKKISNAFNMWLNYFEPNDIVFDSEEEAIEKYKEIKSGKRDRESVTEKA